jgi:hypothetical protein
MYLKCANPDCCAEFDYREGRLFCFRKSPSEGELPASGHSVMHFWFCTPCSEIYTIERHPGAGVRIRRRFDVPDEGKAPHFIAGA